MAKLDQVFIQRPEVEKLLTFSQAVKTDGLLFVAGSASMDDDGNLLGAGDMKAQIKHTYEGILRTLSAHGLTFANVIKETIFTTDIDALMANTDARAIFYDGLGAPASTAVEIKRLVLPGYLIEIEVIAQRK